MACSYNLSSSFLSSTPLHNFGKFKAVPSISRISRKRTIICEAKEEEPKSRENKFNFLKLSVTLTVISASLPQPSSAAKVSEKRRSRKKSEVITAEELKKWGKDLPVISHRLAYSEILDLKRENKLKHVIKPPIAGLKLRPQVVLAVLEDNEVVRIVLPSIDSDPKFWEQWDELKIDGICVNAYTPPLKKPEIPAPFLLDLLNSAVMMFPAVTSEPEPELESESKWRPKPQSKKALELKRMRKELKRAKTRESESSRKEREKMEKTIKMQKKMEERQKREEMRKMRYEEALWEASENLLKRGQLWSKLADDQNFVTVMGWCFFFLFYHTVVFSYRKQRKDYEDRLKIEKAEAEEKKKMRELDKEMEGIEDDNDDEEGGTSGENAYMKVAQKFMRSGARVRRPKHRRPPQYLETGVDVKFSDVAGLGKIRLELEEVVKFFTHTEIYSRRGVKIPGGILLCGPPGVGKTLLAKAVAGEAGVNFFSISASQFVEIYVGVGASRVRALYQEAKDNAPSIVFIDELDAVGRERGHTSGSGGQERDATLNQLLVCLDGFEGRGEVITIASTNRPDILDPALVRPGRFDRKIHIPEPGHQGRIEILKVHARKKPMAPDVDYATVADITEGMVGAELANIIEVAAINMMRDGRTEIRTDDLLQAAQIEEQGLLENRERSNETVKQIAINEAAMAVVAVNVPDLNNIEYITIDPRGGSELGYVRTKMDQMKFKEGMFSRQSFLDYITIQLAPRAADELWHGEGQLSTIWADTADNARSAARSFVLGGLSEKHYGLNNFWTTDRINDIDTEALRVLNMCYEHAKEILQQNWKLLEAVVTNLVEKKNLTKIEFFNLVDLHGSLRSLPPSIVDIRSAQRSQLQNMIGDKKEAVLQGRS